MSNRENESDVSKTHFHGSEPSEPMDSTPFSVVPKDEDFIVEEDTSVLSPANWYYTRDEIIHGPVPETDIAAALKEGRLTGNESAWKEGDSTSRQLKEIEAFSSKIKDPVISGPSLFEHMEMIENIVQSRCRNKDEYHWLMSGGGTVMAGAAAFAGSPGLLHQDRFGNMYSGDSIFRIGNTGQMGQPGLLHQDRFGNMYSGDSLFKVGNTGHMGQPGLLHADRFGSMRAGDSPFVIGEL